jgi:hypothetical protein
MKSSNRRHNASYASGINSLTPAHQFAEQLRQQDEIFRSEVRPSGRQNQERIVSDNVGPRRWERAHPSLPMLPKKHAMLSPGVAIANQFVLTTAQRMERVRYTESLRILATTGS